MKRIIPSISNEVITLVKDTSLARVIAFAELIQHAEEIMAQYGIMWPLLYTGIFYLVSKAKIKEPKEIVDKTSFEQEMSMFWFVVCMMIIPIFTIFGIAPLVQSTQEKEFVEQKRTAIYSIKTETGMYGSFCLGYGQIQTEMYYFYYTQGDFGYKIEKIKANNNMFAFLLG